MQADELMGYLRSMDLEPRAYSGRGMYAQLAPLWPLAKLGWYVFLVLTGLGLVSAIFLIPMR